MLVPEAVLEPVPVVSVPKPEPVELVRVPALELAQEPIRLW